jgi:hypothetical protein
MDNSCPLVTIAKVIPSSFHPNPAKARREIEGPSSLKKLYPTNIKSGGPGGLGFYEYNNSYFNRPCGTMNDSDYSVPLSKGAIGASNLSKVWPPVKPIWNHFKVFPQTHRYVKEMENYSGVVLPFPEIKKWQTKPVVDSRAVSYTHLTLPTM